MQIRTSRVRYDLAERIERGERFREKLRKSGVSMAAVARATGLTYNQIRKLSDGGAPSHQATESIRAAFGDRLV